MLRLSVSLLAVAGSASAFFSPSSCFLPSMGLRSSAGRSSISVSRCKLSFSWRLLAFLDFCIAHSHQALPVQWGIGQSMPLGRIPSLCVRVAQPVHNTSNVNFLHAFPSIKTCI
jgi:hypothetical protein